MAQLSYTVGSWTIVSKEVDTISTAKSVSIPDLDYAHDYSAAAQSSNRTELLNTSGTSLEPVETLQYSAITVDNIFHGLQVPNTAKTCPKEGRGVIVSSAFFIEATNGLTGESWTFPLRLQTKVESITHNVVTKTALDWALARHDAALRATGGTDASLILNAFRGDTDPTK